MFIQEWNFAAQSFPTPMEEPKKILRAQYLGSMQVTQASGMEVLNNAIDRLVSDTPQDQWQSVNVAVAPSMITIQQPSVSYISDDNIVIRSMDNYSIKIYRSCNYNQNYYFNFHKIIL